MTQDAPGPRRDETEFVVLVDEQDREIGTEAKLAAHRGEGVLHRAFSVFVFDGRGRLLLQRRAATKYHFGDRWTNTCCGHPRPGEAVEAAARRRLREELRVDVELSPAARFTYRARDEASGLVEHEIDHVMVGRFEGEPDPDPEEASGVWWATAAELDREMAAAPESFTPWFAIALQRLREARPELYPPRG